MILNAEAMRPMTHVMLGSHAIVVLLRSGTTMQTHMHVCLLRLFSIEPITPNPVNLSLLKSEDFQV